MDKVKNVSTVCQLNVDGLSSHCKTAMDNFITDNGVEILALQEVGKSTVPTDSFVGKTTFSAHCVRGVALSISKKFKPQLIQELESDEIDAIFSLCSINKMSVLVSSVYCRPEISSTKSLRDLIKQIDTAWKWCRANKVPNMVVFGDFNARSTSWGDALNNARGNLLSNYVEDHNHVLLHSSDSNTYLHSNGGSIIDLSLVYGNGQCNLSDPWTEHCYTLFTGAPQKGHIPVLQNFILGPSTAETRRTAWDYDSADWPSWNRELHAALSQVNHRDLEPQQMFSIFLEEINKCSKRHIPLKKLCKHSKPFWSENLSVLSKDLQKAQVQYKRQSDPRNHQRLLACKLIFEESLISEKNSWIHRQLENMNTKESLDFWKRYKKQFCKKEDNYIGHLRNSSRGLTQKDEEKEDILFNSYFTGKHMEGRSFNDEWLRSMENHVEDLKQRNWDIEEDLPPEIISSVDDSNEFLNSEISFDEVVHAIAVQKTAGKCQDPDKFHPLLLKKLPNTALRYLTDMYNRVLDKGQWLWDSSLVCFIRKADKDSYLLPGSFRPITLASYIGKILERVLQKRLLLYCQREDIIDEAQEGFLPKRSTTRYLYKMMASVREARRRKLSAILLFIDFEKAFDSVPTSGMIYKLNR